MTKESIFTSIQDIEAIPNSDLPLLVLSANSRSFVSWAIRARTGSEYNHLMWMHRPGFFASQDWWYREIPVANYKRSRLKFWSMPNWSKYDREWIVSMINSELSKPWWKTRYDVAAIIGQLLGAVRIEVPWTKICSDWAELLKIADSNYDLDHPDPEDVNRYLKNDKRYICYCRYTPD